MSNFCLIAASLMSQGQAPGLSTAVLPAELPIPMPSMISRAVARLCEATSDTYVPARPLAESHLPESSRQLALRSVAASQPQAQPQAQAQAQKQSQAQPQAQAQPVRPTSGSQLFQQRWAALRTGKLYTRLAVDSFRDAWINATEKPSYQQWVSLLKKRRKP
ncbi:MAG: hypothetical protein HC772_04235 [Leptolyngbyaceae cyanobacterium CRU_2_3]|nr:hypothetical protein [Leptolyngbyaceae cyanobacterium CRU_2_3]